jgi:hypothetical protein
MRVNEIFIEMNSWRLEVGRFEKETESVPVYEFQEYKGGKRGRISESKTFP